LWKEPPKEKSVVQLLPCFVTAAQGDRAEDGTIRDCSGPEQGPRGYEEGKGRQTSTAQGGECSHVQDCLHVQLAFMRRFQECGVN
jgi:hypothetical protein